MESGDIFFNSEKLKALSQALRSQDDILIEELWNAPKALVASLAQQATGKHILILTGASQEEVRLFHDFAFFSDRPVVDFPAWETLPSENISPSPDIVGERYRALHEITSSGQPHIILTSLQACLQCLIPPHSFSHLYLTLKTGEVFVFDDLIKRLVEMGYQRRAVASDKGEFAVRGGIVDVYPVSSPDPYRIEFWGDEIESIRLYDPIGQKSIRPIERFEATPALELEFVNQGNQLSNILDYLGPQTLVVFDDLVALEDRYAALINISEKSSPSFLNIETFLDQLKSFQKIYLTQNPIEELSEIRIKERLKKGYYSESATFVSLSFQMFNRQIEANRWISPFIPVSQYLLPEQEEVTAQELFFSLGKLAHTDHQLQILCGSEQEEINFQKRLHDAQITLPKKTQFVMSYLSSGLVIADLNLVIFPLTELTLRYKIRRQKQRSTYHSVPSEMYDLSPGDLVVHLNNGIGKYLGMEKKLNHNGVMSEFFVIEYFDNAKLYVPLNQVHYINKYIGASEEIPRLHALGSNRWKNTKEQTLRAIEGYAKDLLQLYAQREMKGGYAYPESTEEMLSFEEEFPFVETEDQLAAIAALKQDMSSPNPMDRLVCGDVGYGKTEVAMRAAFKAVADGQKQVAVLVPTTVLAMQHYENFCERMSNFPVNIGVLSRFRTAKETRTTLEGVANGSVDILIGTHRIISEDVIFKDLGLIIIDEEQRFGVKAKEHLKKIKIGVDCLTLSATPIPRTLYMSLIGARDMSVINTPPQDRLPITTIIAEPNDQTIKTALLRELARDGQAFIIHNRVETIMDVAIRVKKLLPQARVDIVHGQMDADEIDSVFHRFKNGLVDVLIATTIVENGIDIPNANTILIDRADHFGLADLYQLRGRVGRWNRRAYAYFLVRNKQTLPEISRKRLNALAEASGYGGGMKIAMRDLEIRGAGNILGTEQSGHVASIGFHLYCKLLKRTVLALQGKAPVNLTDTKIEVPFDARLPEDYVNEITLRMEIYQKLGEAISWEEVDLIWEELKDRFGDPPLPARWLHHVTRLRVYGSLNGVSLIKLDKFALTIDHKIGKETKTTRHLVNMPKTPEDLEKVVLKYLTTKKLPNNKIM